MELPIIQFAAAFVAFAILAVLGYLAYWKNPRSAVSNQYTEEIRGLRDAINRAIQTEINLREKLRQSEVANTELAKAYESKDSEFQGFCEALEDIDEIIRKFIQENAEE